MSFYTTEILWEKAKIHKLETDNSITLGRVVIAGGARGSDRLENV